MTENVIENGPAASRRYSSPMETVAQGITAAVAVTTILGLLLFGFMPPVYQIITGLFVAFSGLALSTGYTFRPIAYGMGPGGVTIYFHWRRLRIPWHTIRAIRVEPKIPAFRAIRTIGTAGALGFLGRYWSPALGFHWRLVTDRSRVVVVYRKVPYCLSPDDPDRFVREAREFLKVERDESPVFPRARAR